MLKRLKSVSMMLFLMGASTGAAYAVASPGVTDLKITQQSGTCTGVVKDATGNCYWCICGSKRNYQWYHHRF